MACRLCLKILVNECKSSLNTTLSIGDKQLHVSAIYIYVYMCMYMCVCMYIYIYIYIYIYSHPQAEYRFIIGEKHSSSLNCIYIFLLL